MSRDKCITLITTSILLTLSFSEKTLSLNLFVAFLYLLFNSFISYKNIASENKVHMSWMAILISVTLVSSSIYVQVICICLIPLSIMISFLQKGRMQLFLIIQLINQLLFVLSLVFYYFEEHRLSFVLLLNALLIRQVQFPFHFWVKKIYKCPDLFPSILFYVLLQSGFLLYAQKYMFYLHSSSLLFQYIPGITLMTGILTAVSALREKKILNRHLLIIISQSCLPLAAYHSFSTTSATGGVIFSLLLAIGGGVFALMAFHFSIQKSVNSLDRFYSLYRVNKNLGLVYLVSGLSIVGLPFTLGFFAEDVLFHGLIKSAPYYAIIYILVTAINAYTVFQTFNKIFFGHTQIRWTPLYVSTWNKYFIMISFLIITCSGFAAGPIASSIEARLIEKNSSSLEKFGTQGDILLKIRDYLRSTNL